MVRAARKHEQQYRNSLVRRELEALWCPDNVRQLQTSGELLNFCGLKPEEVVKVAVAGVVAPGAPRMRVFSLGGALQRGGHTTRRKRRIPPRDDEAVRQEVWVANRQHNSHRRQGSSHQHARTRHRIQVVHFADTPRPSTAARHGGENCRFRGRGGRGAARQQRVARRAALSAACGPHDADVALLRAAQADRTRGACARRNQPLSPCYSVRGGA